MCCARPDAYGLQTCCTLHASNRLRIILRHRYNCRGVCHGTCALQQVYQHQWYCTRSPSPLTLYLDVRTRGCYRLSQIQPHLRDCPQRASMTNEDKLTYQATHMGVYRERVSRATEQYITCLDCLVCSHVFCCSCHLHESVPRCDESIELIRSAT